MQDVAGTASPYRPPEAELLPDTSPPPPSPASPPDGYTWKQALGGYFFFHLSAIVAQLATSPALPSFPDVLVDLRQLLVGTFGSPIVHGIVWCHAASRSLGFRQRLATSVKLPGVAFLRPSAIATLALSLFAFGAIVANSPLPRDLVDNLQWVLTGVPLFFAVREWQRLQAASTKRAVLFGLWIVLLFGFLLALPRVVPWMLRPRSHSVFEGYRGR